MRSICACILHGSPVCKFLRITRFLDFVYRPEFQILENTTFPKLGLYPSSGEGKGDAYSIGYLRKS
jgi:hypothetical protein